MFSEYCLSAARAHGLTPPWTHKARGLPWACCPLLLQAHSHLASLLTQHPGKASAGLQPQVPARQRWQWVMRFLSFLDLLALFLTKSVRGAAGASCIQKTREQPCLILSSPTAQTPPRKSRLDTPCSASGCSLLICRGLSPGGYSGQPFCILVVIPVWSWEETRVTSTYTTAIWSPCKCVSITLSCLQGEALEPSGTDRAWSWIRRCICLNSVFFVPFTSGLQ